MNSVKIYGAHSGRYGSNRDAQERFWRCILAGFASARFHRPPSGLGLSKLAQAHLRSMRLFLDAFNIYDSEPRLDLLEQRSWNEAYCSVNQQACAVFFTDGGSVFLNTRDKTPCQVRWLNILESEWLAEITQSVDEVGRLSLKTPQEEGYWLALIQASR